MNDDPIKKEVLTKYKKIAVLGLSPDPNRPSFGVAQYMLSKGYEITPVRPDGVTIFGVKSCIDLSHVPKPLEIVNVFRRSEFVAEIVEECLLLKPKVIWFQDGVTDLVAENKARAAGITVFSDCCILRDHSRLFR